MQIKPLAFTLLFFGVLAFGADFWLSRSATQPFFEQSQLISAPASDVFPEAAAASVPIERPELDWLDKTISIGGNPVLEITERIQRCAAVNVDPQSGERDMNLLRTLDAGFGHEDCGMYARVAADAVIHEGDEVTVAE